MRLSLLLAVVAAPFTRAVAQDTAAVIVYQQARVRAQVPSVGPGWQFGSFSRAKISGQICLGLLLDVRDAAGAPRLILLKGISRLDVDRRTNIPAIAIGLPSPGEADWATIDLPALRQSDATCPLKGKPRS